jgi:hypothetical protein
LTSLVDHEEVELKFTAPSKPGKSSWNAVHFLSVIASFMILGHYSFTVHVRSDSYLGIDVQEDIKLDVQEAREAPTEHPQWEFEDEDEDENSKGDESDDEFATDEDFDEDDD